MHQLVNKRIW